MIRIPLFCLGIVLVVTTIAQQAHAAISFIGGSVEFVANPPADIANGNWESNTQIFAFNEEQDLTLPSEVQVDISRPGTSQGGDENLSTADIAAGTQVNSYYVHFDPTGPKLTSLSGSVTLSNPVLGLIALSPTLEASNSVPGLPAETYDIGDEEGLEIYQDDTGPTADSVTLSADRYTVSFDLSADTGADDLRIITAVPEPSCASIMAIVVLAILGRQRAIRRSARTAG